MKRGRHERGRLDQAGPSLDGLAELARLSVDGSTESIERILSLARAALDMDVAVMAAFDGDFVVQAVDGEHEWFDLDVGLRLPVNQTYCGPMTKGEIPHLVNDAAARRSHRDLPLTREAGIGAYVGVPIRLWDGTLYGTLCCLSRSAEPSLNGRDVRFLRVLAEIVADQLDRDQLETEKRRLEWSRIRSILERRQRRRRVPAGLRPARLQHRLARSARPLLDRAHAFPVGVVRRGE